VETTTALGFDPARHPGARRHLLRRTGFIYIPDSHPEERREVGEAGLVAILYYNRGVQLTREKRYHEALLAYFRAMSLDPEFDSAVKNTLAVLANWSGELGRKGQYEEALAVLTAGLALAPKDAALLHNRRAVWSSWVQALVRAGKEDEALAIVQKALAAVPEEAGHFHDLQAWITMRQGEELLQKGQWQRAATLVHSGLRRLQGPAQLELRRWKSALYLRWAQAELQQSHLEEAVRALEQGLAAEPQDRQLAGYLAAVLEEWVRNIQAQQGEAAAEAFLDKLPQRYPQAAGAGKVGLQYVASGVLHRLDEGKYEEALTFIDGSQRWLPDRGKARELVLAVHDLWADQYAARKDWARAADVYVRGLQRYANDPHLEHNLLATWDAWAKPALERKDWATALEVYARARTQLPANEHVRNNLTYVILRLTRETASQQGEKEGKKQLTQLEKRFGLKDLGTGFVYRELKVLVDAGRYQEGVALLDRSADLLANKAEVKKLYLGLYAAWGKKVREEKDLPGVVEVYRQAVDHRPEEDDLRILFLDAVREAVNEADARKGAERAGAVQALLTRFPGLVDRLTRALQDRSPPVRGPAAEALGKLGATSATAALEQRVADDVWYVSGYSNVPDDPKGGGKGAALKALAELAPSHVVRALVQAAKSKNLYVRVWALGELGKQKEAAQNEDARAALVGALEMVGPGDEGGTAPGGKNAIDPGLMVRLVHRGMHPRKVAAESLEKRGDRFAIAALKKRVTDNLWYSSGYSNVPNDPEGGGKAAALRALKSLAPEAVSAALQKAAGSPTPAVQLWALAGLKEHAPKQLTAALLVATKAKSVRVRSWALRELGEHKDNATNEQALAALTNALTEKVENTDEVVRLVLKGEHPRKLAAESLQKLAARAAIPALKKRVADDLWYGSGYSNVSSDPEGGGKAAALAALKTLAPEEAADALRQASKSTNANVRQWAEKEAKALKQSK
jgi:tetratricopeptide (TPR) repeat protein